VKYIPFNRPFVTTKEFDYIQQALSNLHLSGNGPFTRRCQAWLEAQVGCPQALLTHSCTAALEMAAILANIQPGDEVIMPSYTFVSTANAFVLRGGVPVFVDIRPDTLNLDETKIEAAITPRTRAIIPVHYAGVGCEMDLIMDISERHSLLVIEDAAQGIMSTYKERPLGCIGHLAAFSFHETKNAISGEGGALLINEPRYVERAEIIWEKGTNRSQFFRGEVDKYTWVDIGASFLPSEITAAFLWAQLEEVESTTRQRLRMWDQYHRAFAELENHGKVRRPIIPAECQHNAHMYYLLLPDLESRLILLEELKGSGINAVFHYVPLHSSPAGRRYGQASGDLSHTKNASDCLVRLPLWVGMAEEDVMRVIDAVYAVLKHKRVFEW
jgi:dTDP-4-amino-4,6-dideoxygalactose transaminase